MKKLYFLLLLTSAFGFSQPILTAIVDGDCTGGSPKVVEIFAQGTVDFSNYNIELQTNANTTWGSSTSLSPLGTRTNEFVYVVSNHEAIFNIEFPSATNYMIAGGPTNFNGDDRVRLVDITTTSVVDQFGTEGVDGSGLVWEYTDSFAKRINGTGPDAGFAESNWTYGGDASLDTQGSCQGGTIFETLMGGIGTYSIGSTPSLVITTPSNGQILNPNTTNVDVVLSINNFSVANGTGDGHIHYTVDSGSVVMQYDTDPITIPVTAGNTYTVAIELVNNSNQPLSPAVGVTVTFTVDSFVTVADLAALRADVVANSAGKYYQVSSSPVISYARTTRNQKYIQDSSAAILIDDVPGTISTPMVAGDAIAGLKGQASLFNGVLQLLPLENATVASSGNTITPQVVTAADIAANIETYESELVQINNATFTAANGTVVFTTNSNTTLNDGSDMIFRPIFAEADYIDEVIPQGAASRVVLVGEFNGTAQVVARSLADVTLSSSSFNAIDGLTMYPNPLKGNTLYLNSTANTTMSVQIFDLLGKEVMKANVVNNTVNVAKLTAGVYVVKITEEGKTATRKLVIQ